jgi:hypothetical protein
MKRDEKRGKYTTEKHDLLDHALILCTLCKDRLTTSNKQQIQAAAS